MKKRVLVFTIIFLGMMLLLGAPQVLADDDKSSDGGGGGGSSIEGDDGGSSSGGGSGGGDPIEDEPSSGGGGSGGPIEDEPSSGGGGGSDPIEDEPSSGGGGGSGPIEDEPSSGGGGSGGGGSSSSGGGGGSGGGGRIVKFEQRTENEKTIFKFKTDGDEIKTELRIEAKTENGKTKIKVRLSDGSDQEITVTPDTAIDTATSVLGSNDIEIELEEETDDGETKAVYKAKTKKKGKLFGLFKISIEIETVIDSETGEVIKYKKKWWAIFVSGEDDDQTGETGTVTLCHVPPGNPDNAQTITVGRPAVRAHLTNHADFLGTCEGEEEEDETPTINADLNGDGAVDGLDQSILKGFWGSSPTDEFLAGLNSPDVNGDGTVDAADNALVLGAFGNCSEGEDCLEDLNGDGVVDALDVSIIEGFWGMTSYSISNPDLNDDGTVDAADLALLLGQM